VFGVIRLWIVVVHLFPYRNRGWLATLAALAKVPGNGFPGQSLAHPRSRTGAKPRAMAISPAPKSGQKAKKARSIAPCLDVSLNAYPLSPSSDR
jgi:hypothetical protein